MSFARTNWRQRQKRAKKIEQIKTQRLLDAFRRNDTEMLDSIYMMIHHESGRQLHLFTKSNQDRVVRKFDLPEPMNYWNACEYANKVLDDEATTLCASREAHC